MLYDNYNAINILSVTVVASGLEHPAGTQIIGRYILVVSLKSC